MIGLAQLKTLKFDDYPEYNEQAMGCGLEDRGEHDRYGARARLAAAPVGGSHG